MRICFICGNLYPLLAGRSDVPIMGGAEVQQKLIAAELACRGMETVFVTEDFGQGPESKVGAGVVYAYRFGRNKAVQAWTLWRALTRAGADAYYVRGLPKFIGLLGLHSLVSRRPLVVGLSSDDGASPRSVARLSWPQFTIYRWVLRRAGAVIAQTESQRGGLARNYGVVSALLIPNGTVIPPAPPAIRPNEGAVLWVGSLHRRKGAEHLLRLAELLPHRRFVVIGGAARTQHAYYEEKRAEASRLPNVTWCGPLPNDKIDELLTGAVALVHTGVEEGFPNVYLEAWRNAVPVVTLDYDPDETICDHALGFHCRSVEKMAESIERLAEDPELRRRLGKSAKEYVEREHGMTQVGESYARLFSRLARGR